MLMAVYPLAIIFIFKVKINTEEFNIYIHHIKHHKQLCLTK